LNIISLRTLLFLLHFLTLAKRLIVLIISCYLIKYWQDKSSFSLLKFWLFDTVLSHLQYNGGSSTSVRLIFNIYMNDLSIILNNSGFGRKMGGFMVTPYVEHCKYLGIIVHLHSAVLDIKRQMRKFYTNVNMLLRKFSLCSYDVKCQLFRSFCVNLYC
jgi:hypothetical protein